MCGCLSVLHCWCTQPCVLVFVAYAVTTKATVDSDDGDDSSSGDDDDNDVDDDDDGTAVAKPSSDQIVTAVRALITSVTSVQVPDCTCDAPSAGRKRSSTTPAWIARCTFGSPDHAITALEAVGGTIQLEVMDHTYRVTADFAIEYPSISTPEVHTDVRNERVRSCSYLARSSVGLSCLSCLSLPACHGKLACLSTLCYDRFPRLRSAVDGTTPSPSST